MSMGWQERVEYEQAQRQQVEEELLRVRQQLAAAIETKVASSPLLSSPLAFVSLTSFPSALHLFSSARVVLATSSPHSQLLLTSPPHHILSTSTLPPPRLTTYQTDHIFFQALLYLVWFLLLVGNINY